MRDIYKSRKVGQRMENWYTYINKKVCENGKLRYIWTKKYVKMENWDIYEQKSMSKWKIEIYIYVKMENWDILHPLPLIFALSVTFKILYFSFWLVVLPHFLTIISTFSHDYSNGHLLLHSLSFSIILFFLHFILTTLHKILYVLKICIISKYKV